MLLPMKALGLARNSDTSIWSSETPGRCVRRGDLRQRVAGLDAVLVADRRRRRRRARAGCRRAVARPRLAAAARGRGAALARCGARRFARGFARSRADGARPAVGGSGVGAGGAAEITGAVVVPARLRRAGARCVAGGSNSSVYSRTSRPVAQEISRMTSTKGSWTPRSLTRRTNRRPSARFCSVARVRRQHRVVVDVGGAIRLGRRDADAQVGLLFGRQAGDFDLGAAAPRRATTARSGGRGRGPMRRETPAQSTRRQRWSARSAPRTSVFFSRRLPNASDSAGPHPSSP